MDVDVPGLTDAEGAVGGLVFDGRVPPPVVVDDVVGARQVQARPARLERQDEHLRAVWVVLETLHHLVAVLARDAAVEHGRLDAVGFLDVLLDDGAHLGELAEDQDTVAGGNDLVQQLFEAGQLAGTAGDGGVVAQQLARVIAHLLELDQRVEDGTAARHALGAFQSRFNVAQHGLVEGDLLPGIEGDGSPIDGSQQFAVPRHSAVAGDDDLVVGGLLGELFAPFTTWSVVQHHRQAGGELLRFPLPVVDHRGRADQQVGPFIALLVVPQNGGQGLDRLAQPHVVGQAGAKAPPAEEIEPRVAQLLVGAEFPHRIRWVCPATRFCPSAGGTPANR